MNGNEVCTCFGPKRCFFFLFDTHRLPLHMRDARREKEKEESEKDEAIRLALVRHQDGFLLSGQLQGDD